MDFETEGNSERFVVEMASLIRRIQRLHAICQQSLSSAPSSELDGPWMRVHGLLMALHEQVADDSDYETLSSSMRQLDRELSVIESAVEVSASFQPFGSLH